MEDLLVSKVSKPKRAYNSVIYLKSRELVESIESVHIGPNGSASKNKSY